MSDVKMACKVFRDVNFGDFTEAISFPSLPQTQRQTLSTMSSSHTTIINIGPKGNIDDGSKICKANSLRYESKNNLSGNVQRPEFIHMHAQDTDCRT